MQVETVRGSDVAEQQEGEKRVQTFCHSALSSDCLCDMGLEAVGGQSTFGWLGLRRREDPQA